MAKFQPGQSGNPKGRRKLRPGQKGTKHRTSHGNPNWKKGVSANPATQFKKGQSGNPGGRPRILKDAQKQWLAAEHPETGKTNAELTAEAQGRKAIEGDTAAYNAIARITEEQSQIEIVGGAKPIEVKVSADQLVGTIRRIYGLSDSGDTASPAPALSLPEAVDPGPIPTKDRDKK